MIAVDNELLDMIAEETARQIGYVSPPVRK